MPKVLNRRVGWHSNAVYVGRPTKWGNPFKIGPRELNVQMYETWILTQPQLMADLHELKDKDLVCWCAPLPCHADILLKLANEINSGRSSVE
jgi:hypothetical protein